MLELQLERLARVRQCDRLVVATTFEPGIEALLEVLKRQGVDYFQGDLTDVLKRYYDAAEKFKAQTIVRITSDCPLIDPELIDDMLKVFIKEKHVDYLANTIEYSLPIGLDVEIFSFEALKQAYQEAKMQAQREHVTPFIYQNPSRFRLQNFKVSPSVTSYRWTVDTVEDLRLVSQIFEDLYPLKPDFTTQDILAAYERHPEWEKINAHIRQKGL